MNQYGDMHDLSKYRNLLHALSFNLQTAIEVMELNTLILRSAGVELPANADLLAAARELRANLISESNEVMQQIAPPKAPAPAAPPIEPEPVVNPFKPGRDINSRPINPPKQTELF